MIIKFILNFCNFRVIICFLTKLLTLHILFLTVVNVVFVAKLVTSGILRSISAILVLLSVFLTRPLVSEILFFNSDLSALYLVFTTNPLVLILSSLATNLLYTSFLTPSFFTASLSLLKSIRTGTNLLKSNLSTSVFNLAKFVFNAKLEVSTCEIFLMLLLHNLKDQL